MTNIFVNKRKNTQAPKKSLLSRMFPKLPNFGAMFFGFLLGIFASSFAVFMFATSDVTLKFPTIGSKKPLQVAQAKPAPLPEKEPHFDFYTELAKTEPVQPKDLKSTKKTINGYIVQAGTFKKSADADAMRAKLTLNGYTAKIDHIKQSNGEVVHKVLLGSFKQEQQAKTLQKQLKTLDIDSVLVLK